MKNALIYCRVSTEEQAQPGHFSIVTQEEMCLKKADELGYKIAGVYKDEGVSGKETDRPAFNKLLAKIDDNNGVEAIIVLHTDRFARNAQFHMEMKDRFRQKGIKLISVFQGEVSYSADGTFTDNMMALVNQHYSDLIAEKTKNGLDKKAKSGWLPGEAPIGYKNTIDKNGNKIIIIDPETGPFIQQIFKLYSTGNYSVEELNREMHSKGLKSKRGLRMHDSKMYYLLRNPFYIGEMHWGGVHLEKAGHTPLVNKELFDRVKQVMDDHNRFACRKRKYSFLLRGIVFCAQCGKRFTASNIVKKNKSYYHCTHCRGSKYITVQDLEQKIADKFKTIQFEQKFIDKVIARVKEIYSQKKLGLNQVNQDLINKKTALEAKRDAAEEKLFAGVITDNDFTRVREKYRQELDTIQTQLDELNNQKEVNLDKVQQVMALTRNIHDTYLKAPFELKKLYLSFFWDRFEVQGDKLVKAVPNRLISALKWEQKQSITFTSQTQKPFLSEMAFVAPSGSYQSDEVRIRNEWGG